MKLYLVMLSLSLSFYSWGQTIGFVGANVCLSINPFAEVLITNNVQLEPIDQSNNGASSLYRGVTTLNLLSNTDVELMVITEEIIGEHHSFTPEVTVGKSKGMLSVPYENTVHEIELQLDVKIDKSEIIKSGSYNGTLNVIVMADLATVSCI